MSLTLQEAYDEMLTMFTVPWKLAYPTFPIIYDDHATTEPPKTELPWARISVIHNRGDQQTLAGPMGNRLFMRDGVIAIQVFTPRGEGGKRLRELGQAAMNTIEGKATPGGVWFRRVNFKEIGPSGNWLQGNVTGEFEYTQTK
jgi:hypothetical protein